MASQPTATIESDPLGRPSRRRRRNRLRTVLIAIAIALVVVAALVVAGGLYLVDRYDKAIPRATLLAPAARATAAAEHAAITGPLNFLLVGSDLRAGEPGDGQRSDTIIVAHLSSALDRLYLVSIPRDWFVDIPADPDLHFGGDHTKINAAFQYGGGGAGGTRLLSETLTAEIGIKFNGAVVVDFAGLQQAVDAVGGVPVCVDQQVTSIHTGVVFAPGCQLMSGARALDYLRQRYGLSEGDFSRQRHQQEFLKALFAKVFSAGTLTNPVKLDSLFRSIAGAMTVDTGGWSVPDLAYSLRGLDPAAVTGVKLPYYLDTADKQSIVRASADADGLFAALRADSLDVWTARHPQWVNQI